MNPGEQPIVEQPEMAGIRNQMPEPVVEEPVVRVVPRHQDADQVVQQVRQNNLAAENNLAALVERIMARSGINTGFARPNFTSPIVDYILQSELTS